MLLHEYVTSLNPSSNCRMWVQNEFKEDIPEFTNVFMQTQGGAVTASCHLLVYCTTGGLEPFHPLCAEIYHRLGQYLCSLPHFSEDAVCIPSCLIICFIWLHKGQCQCSSCTVTSDCADCPVSGYCVRLQSFCKPKCRALVLILCEIALLEFCFVKWLTDSQYLKELRRIQLVCPSSKLNFHAEVLCFVVKYKSMPEIIREIFKPFDWPVDKLKWNLKPHDFSFYIWATSIRKECWECIGLAVFPAFANSKMNIRTSIFILKNVNRTLFYFK